MKLFLRNPQNFSKEAREFYEQNFELTNEKESNIIVVNDFEVANYPNKIVAINATCADSVRGAKKIVKLEPIELSEFTAVSELIFSMLVYTLRIFKKEEAKGKTIGIIGGQGRISSHLIKIAEFMGMNVICYDIKD